MLPTWAFIVFYSYGIPLLVVYSLIAYTLLTRRREFPTTFYRLVAIFAIQDIIGYINAQLCIRGALSMFVHTHFFASLETRHQWFPVFFIFTRFATELYGELGTVILATYRISAMVFPLTHNQLWRKYLPVLLAFHFAAPFCLYSFIFWNNGTIECAYKNGQVEGCMLNYDHTVLLFGFLYIIHINQFLFLVIPIISALLNLIALVLLYSRKRLLKSQRTWKHEINLSLNTAATFISHVGYGLITQRILLPYTKLDLGFVTFVLGCVIPLIQDASIFIMVTSLLIASERLRSEVLKIFVKPWMIASWGSKFSSTLSPQLGTVFNARS